jgi:nitric oxide reductase activation protein
MVCSSSLSLAHGSRIQGKLGCTGMINSFRGQISADRQWKRKTENGGERRLNVDQRTGPLGLAEE